jgi:ATP-binding cassette subfamily B protein IrtB
MSQESCLIDDTIYNNIRCGRPEASEMEILEAAEKARVLDFVLELREGIQTRIGEGGIHLTSGQRSLIGVARALLKGEPVNSFIRLPR